MVDIWRLYPTLLYRSYKRDIDVLYRVCRLGIACGLSACYALIWRTMACIWRCIAHGYAVMAYGIGVGIGVGYRRVWSVVCVRCVFVRV